MLFVSVANSQKYGLVFDPNSVIKTVFYLFLAIFGYVESKFRCTCQTHLLVNSVQSLQSVGLNKVDALQHVNAVI